jgi:hypothetical protein
MKPLNDYDIFKASQMVLRDIEVIGNGMKSTTAM